MKKTSLALGLIALVSACSAPAALDSSTRDIGGLSALQDGGAPDPAMMEAMAKFMTPGKPHRELAKQVGTWNVHSTMAMGPGLPEMTMDSVVKAKMIFGDRYYIEESKGNFMGQAYEGQLTMGYNTLTEKYWTIWIDTMTTNYITAEGTKHDDGNIYLEGTMSDYMTPEGRPYRMVCHAPNDEGQMVYEMYDTNPEGTEFKVMTMTYTRAEG